MTLSTATDRALRVLAVPIGAAGRDVLAISLPPEAAGMAVTVVDAGAARAAEVVVRDGIEVALIATNGQEDETIAMVERLVRSQPELAIVILALSEAEGFVDRALLAGAEDVLFAPELPERVALALRKAHARLARARTVAATPAAEGRLIAVVGPKGGSGKTMTSSNLATLLALGRRKTLLIDLDLEFGDCAIVLGIKPERTIYDLVTAPGALDEDKLAGYVTRHEPSGLDVLIAPARPDQAERVSAARVEEIFEVARRMYEFIVVDSAPAFTPTVISTVDAADEVVLLASMDVPSLKDARLGLDTLELMGRRRDDVRVVVNRANSKGGLSLTRVAEALERPIDIIVPSDAAVPSSYNHGTPLAIRDAKNGVAKAIGLLAESVSGRAAEERRSWRLLGGKR